MLRALSTLSFALGFSLVLTSIAGIDIYGLEHFEKMWGKGISFQVSLWLIGAGAVIVSLSFTIGVAVFRLVPSNIVSLCLGAVFAAVVLGTAWGGELLSAATALRQAILVAFMLLGGFCIPGLLALRNRHREEHHHVIAG